jgi:hypothetical protein
MQFVYIQEQRIEIMHRKVDQRGTGTAFVQECKADEPGQPGGGYESCKAGENPLSVKMSLCLCASVVSSVIAWYNYQIPLTIIGYLPLSEIRSPRKLVSLKPAPLVQATPPSAALRAGGSEADSPARLAMATGLQSWRWPCTSTD